MERFLHDLSNSLASAGVECSVLVHDLPGGLPSPTTASPGIPSAANGVRVERVKTVASFAFTPISPSFRSRLDRMVRSFQPQVIHLHLPNPSAFWLMTLDSCRRLPWIVHWHADVVGAQAGTTIRALYPAYRVLEQRLLRFAARIVVTSPPYLESSRTLDRWKEKCSVIPLAIPDSSPPPSSRQHREWATGCWRQDLFRLLFLGRLTYYKGLEVLLRAAVSLEGTSICIAGDGPDGPRLHGLARRLGLGDRVRFLGHCDDLQARALIESSQCVCLPSLERSEAFGLVLLEAMATGKPAIASDIPGSGTGWVVEHEHTGLLVRPDSAEHLQAAICRLRDKPEFRNRLGENARLRHRQRFSMAETTRRIVEEYQTAIDRCGNSRAA